MNPVLAFYLGSPDINGRYLSTVLKFSDDDFECIHDWIQWVFPSQQISAFNPWAPILDEDTIDIWNSSPALQNKLMRSVRVYLGFLERTRENWNTEFNHNHLRITRMLECMRVLGLSKQAKHVLLYIEMIATNANSTSREFWRNEIL